MFKKIASNTISQIFSKVWTAIIAIFLIWILTKYLTVELYGTYSKVYNYVWIFVFLADLWLYAITIREITNNKEKSSFIVWNVMSLRLVLGILILFLSVWIAFFLPGYNEKLIIISIFTILQLLNSSILALMQANMKVEYSAFTLIIWKLVNLFWVWSIAYIFYPKEFIQNSDYFSPFIYIMIVWVISVLINTIMNYFYARKIVKFSFSWDFEYIKYIFKISVPYWVALFLSVVYFKMDVIILSIMEPQNIADRNISLYSLPLVFVLWVLFRDYIIRIIATEDYLSKILPYNSSDAFLIVFAVVLFYFISLVFIYTFVATERQNKLLKINVIVTIFNFIWNILLIPKFSFMWAWFVTLLSQILLLTLWYFGTKDLVKFSFPKKFILVNILFWTFMLVFWNYILSNFKISLYVDFLLYWTIFWAIYLVFFFFIYKKYIKI